MSTDYITAKADIGGNSVGYLCFGHGPRPMVIIPGISLSSVLLSAGSVTSAYETFTDTHTVYLFDRADKLSEGCTIRRMAADTAAAMQQLGISAADVFGASQGGMIALCLAIDRPELAGRLAVGSSMARAGSMSRRVLGSWEELARRGDRIALNRCFHQNVYSEEYRALYAEVFESLLDCGTPEELKRLAIQCAACRDFDIFAELPAISCPVFVIGSEKDCVLGPEASREIASALGCRLLMYEGFSHAVFDEAPDYRKNLFNFFTGKD